MVAGLDAGNRFFTAARPLRPAAMSAIMSSAANGSATRAFGGAGELDTVYVRCLFFTLFLCVLCGYQVLTLKFVLNLSVAFTSSAQMPGSHAEWPASGTMM